jgi:methylenetetrahydrofolate dehydrogenase (NADP+)/methenyltetrahydrofolate cyclohydrolase/formyltetrahydrofolate synthetase
MQMSSKLGKLSGKRFAPSSITSKHPLCRSTCPIGLTTLQSGDCFSTSVSPLAPRSLVSSRSRSLLPRPGGLLKSTSSSARSHHHRDILRQEKSFSSTASRMAATKIDGTAIAKEIRERLNAHIKTTQESNPRFKPSLKIIQGMQSSSSDWS